MLAAVETDAVVGAQFLRVIGMVDSPARLMRPAIMTRVLRANLARSRRVPERELSLAR